MQTVKQASSKFSRALMLALLLVANLLPILQLGNRVKADEIDSSKYSLTTRFLINNNTVKNGSEYGEGKFYFEPAFTFTNDAVLKNGDTLNYTVPSTFALEASPVTNLTGSDGTVVGTLTVNPTTNVATITITNEDYFKAHPDDKTIKALFTATWAPSVPRNVEQTFTVPGLGEYKLTRVVPDNDPTGYTKWGGQDKNDPTLVNWRVRVNRYASEDVTNAVIKDTIPANQTLVGNVTGYYFDSWSVTGKITGQKSFNQSIVTEKTDNSFTVTPDGQGLKGRGIYLIYQTKITGPVDLVEKKVYNSGVVTSAEGDHPFDGFAALTVTDGLGGATSEVEASLAVTKKLEGRSLQADEFSFELFDPTSNRVLQTKKNQADGTVKFDNLKFTNVGTYTYKIRELASNLPAVQNDANSEITATVNVTEENGEKKVATIYDRPSFTNTYTPSPVDVTLAAKKIFLGSKLLEKGQFTFELLNQADSSVLAETTNEADGSIVFPKLSFKKAGDYYYQIREKSLTNTLGITYDQTVIPVHVKVTDDNQGNLSTQVDYGQTPNFTNSYKPLDGSLQFKAKASLEGRDLKAGEFSFQVKDENGKVVDTISNDANGQLNFKSLNFSEAEVGKHTYTISQVKGSDPTITYDEKEVKVTVDVKDNNGQIVATPTYETEAEFKNTYKPSPTSVQLKTQTKLTGRDLKENEFQVVLKDSQGNTLQEKPNAADGQVNFDQLTFDKPGTYTYSLLQKSATIPGVTLDSKEVQVTVTVTDKDGKLEAQVSYDGQDATSFDNRYEPAATTADLKAQVKLTGRELKEGEFTFKVVDEAGNELTAKNKADGSLDFTPPAFTKPGTYTYTVSQVKGSEPGMTYDESNQKITVTVTDDGQGQLKNTVSAAPSFSNHFAEPNAATLHAKVNLNGRELKEGEFTFKAVDQDGNEIFAKNKADGSLTFVTPAFTKPGTYTYTLSQVKGDDPGVTYDGSSQKITVTVIDNGQGQLVVEVLGTAPSFNNSYKEPNVPNQDDSDPSNRPTSQGRKTVLPRTGQAMSSFLVLLGLSLLGLALVFTKWKKA
ncbi:Spy0128 family protein [Streptococcus oricebi]|uniref:LPXTG cell wall anchor domain-containing protein n=1 Tax=Streptococcus oricebi TaxID=1547447 RepID=A0ABS5B0Q3_9STRE|nr:FctA domain-containing protein [Streptococcus oricebi]MBP2622405.1 hypothetical protein [Streptococcus oricebi]